jgi:chromosome segregation protein
VRLTQIRLSGFKSFVDPTMIRVPGQLVGVVGPNGCGKSNVIDAVRWVLGESRASALRGDSMQDVIFNGSAQRKALARASVELVFDNSLGRASGQWSQYAELSVKRILQRDGESSYYINNMHVRRRDVTDLFLGTGLGPRAYAIVEQGMISRVIEAKPEELRVFLEEAAGVSRYKERRKETETRLAETRENLARVNDIRHELGMQLEKLEAQATVASQYREYQQNLQLRQQLLWFVRRREAAAERDRHAQEIGRVTNEMEADTARLRQIESQVETARAAHYEAGDTLNAAQAALYAANAEVARHESELRYVEETRQRLESEETERRAQLAAWREQRAQFTQSLHAWAARSAVTRLRVLEMQQALASEAARTPSAERSHRLAQERHNAARDALVQTESRLQVESANLAHLDQQRLSLLQRRDRLDAELHSLEKPDAQQTTQVEQRLADVCAALDRSLADLERLQAEAAGVDARRDAAAERVAAAEREQTAAEAQLATLVQVQAAADENAPLDAWLERRRLGAVPRLWQKVRIEAGWETAVEAVLRERLHALEVGGADALSALDADRPPVKASAFARASASAPAPLPEYTPLAQKVQVSDPAIAGALGDWLHRVYAVDRTPSVQEREALPAGAVLVGRNGDQFTRCTVTYYAPDAADAGILARQAEIDLLRERSRHLAAQTETARAAATGTQSELEEREASLEAGRGRIAVLQGEKHAAEIERLKLSQALQRFEERAAQVRAELAEIQAERTLGDERLELCRAAIARIGAEIEAARSALGGVQAEYHAAEAELAERRQALQRAEREAQDAIFSERECGSKISELDNSVRMVDLQITRAEDELGKLDKELAVDPVPAVRHALDAAVEARIDCERALAGTRESVEAAAGVLRGFEEERLQTETRIAPLRERVVELRMKEQAAQINHDQFDGQLREANVDEERLAAESERAPRPSALQGEITRLSQAIQELGAVNLAALEELGTSTERKNFLDAQATDLDEAVTTLEDAIRRIDRDTRELLRGTFDTVNRNFGALFPILFGGGEAGLRMTGEEVLDAGVQVMAQPPGKRNTSIHLLSGGEKALTAIALVFALFQLNPAPFCLLDEVDAPLDDTNTDRFCELVRKMSAQTQFLFISHNKITMEMAGQLIGVTMPESGVSRVVAVDIEEALRLREELAA